MTTYHHLGVFIEEESALTPLVKEVDTALPAFVGYTEKASRRFPGDLILVPTKVQSLKDFENHFGYPYENELEIEVVVDPDGDFVLSNTKEPALLYLLYYSIRIYFENGGAPCYILSVGTYEYPQQVLLKRNSAGIQYGLMDGLHRLEEVTDLTLIVIPEAIKLCSSDYATLAQAALLQCYTLGNRFAIFDLYGGDSAEPDLSQNRAFYGSEYLNFGSAYYPFVKTSMGNCVNDAETNITINLGGQLISLRELKEGNRPLYRFVRKYLQGRLVSLPPCGAVAGVYVTTDRNRGVWKSPVNLSLVGITEPVVTIDNRKQEILNDDPDSGKSINSIRTFTGKGIQVWGARTLAGNDNEWRYVPVSRFLIMVRESLHKSAFWVVFEPNEDQTWSKVRAMIENYLIEKWQNGALAGIHAHLAFYVKCGLGSTMTDQDILDGRIIVEVGLAMLRPSEFIVFRLSYQLKNR